MIHDTIKLIELRHPRVKVSFLSRKMVFKFKMSVVIHVIRLFSYFSLIIPTCSIHIIVCGKNLFAVGWFLINKVTTSNFLAVIPSVDSPEISKINNNNNKNKNLASLNELKWQLPTSKGY